MSFLAFTLLILPLILLVGERANGCEGFEAGWG